MTILTPHYKSPYSTAHLQRGGHGKNCRQGLGVGLEAYIRLVYGSGRV